MTFLTGSELYLAIKEIAKGKEPCFAVAFWGDGSEALIGKKKDARIICNLASGSTNPNVIEGMKKDGIDVQQLDTLHAKVYLNEKAAIVTSTNASTNGLGLEGEARWEEAGVLVDDPEALAKIKIWFDEMWGQSKEILDKDIQRAKKIWGARKNHPLPRTSFADFTEEELHPILINWCYDEDWKLPAKHTKGKSKKEVQELKKLVGDGVDIEGKKDREVLTQGMWVIFFEINEECKPIKNRNAFYWVQLGGTILTEAIQYDKDKPLDVALPVNSSAAEPFPLDKEFRKSFIKIIGDEKFAKLRTDDYEGAWFTTRRLTLMKEFWNTLHKDYTARK